jgi:nickel/cobalt transporter (NicO) family protein
MNRRHAPRALFVSLFVLFVLLMVTLSGPALATDVFGRGDVRGSLQTQGETQSKQSTEQVDGVAQSVGPAVRVSQVHVSIPGVVRRLFEESVALQSQLNHHMTTVVDVAGRDRSMRVWLAVVVAAFAYGVLHAFGPGHGKTVIAGYLASHRASVSYAAALCGWVALVQSASAIILVGVVAGLLNAGIDSLMSRAAWLESASYAAVCVAGLWTLWAVLARRDCCEGGAPVRLLAAVNDRAGCGGEESAEVDAYLGLALRASRSMVRLGARNGVDRGSAWVWREIIALGWATGIRPCTGAVFILLSAIASHNVWIGVVAALAMGAGVALTLVVLGCMSMGTNWAADQLAQRFLSSRGGASMQPMRGVYRALAATGAAALVIIAGFECAALALGWVAPGLS